MKNSTFKPLLLLLSVVLITSCSEDDDNALKSRAEFPAEFSELTVEQNKEKLEDNGIDLVNNMTQLKSTGGVKTSASFNHFLSMATLPETQSGRTASSTQPVALIRLLAKFGAGKASASDVLSGARVKEHGPGTPQEAFDDFEGVFTYNATENTWTHTATNDGKIVFKFPSTKESTSNDAQFAIYGYASVQVQNTAAEYTGDVPTALKADLTVNGTKEIEYNFSASYKSNGEPTSVLSTFTIGAFKFAVEAKNTTSEITVDYSLKNGDKNMLSLGAGATGNFNSDNIENSNKVGSVLTNSSAYFQIMNIKFAGEVNVKGIDDAGAWDGNLAIEEEANAWNANAKLVAFYADSKKKIADTEFYGTERTESDTYCWDSNGDGIEDDCDTWTETYQSVDIRLIFADGSKADLQTYTDVGFEDITTEIEAFINSLEADFE